MGKLFIALTFFIVSSARFYSQEVSIENTLETKLQSVVDSLTTASNYPGMVFSYVEPDGEVVSLASGYADLESQEKMTANHKMLSGSTGKTFVSAIAFKLMEQGKLDLYEPLKKYIGKEDWFAKIPNHETLIIKHLMNHSSGIQRYEFKPEFIEEVVKDADRIWQPVELLQYIFNDEPLFEAGKGYSYADTNYILLGMVIEQIAGKTFYELLETDIVTPFKLTSITPSSIKKIDGMACGYSGEENLFKFTNRSIDENGFLNNTQFEWTGGGLAFKTSDYARWLKLLHEGKVFNMRLFGGEFYDAIETNEGGKYGLGVQVFELPQLGTLYGHMGFFPGYLTLGFYNPDTKVVGVMQINTSEDEKLKGLFRNYMALMDVLIKNYKG